MDYNKKELNKVNDKKLLHKVKKQWVIISLSLFLAIGASGVMINNSNPIEVHADESTSAASKGSSSNNNQSSNRESQSNQNNSNVLNQNNVAKSNQPNRLSNTSESANNNSAVEEPSRSNSSSASSYPSRAYETQSVQTSHASSSSVDQSNSNISANSSVSSSKPSYASVDHQSTYNDQSSLTNNTSNLKPNSATSFHSSSRSQINAVAGIIPFLIDGTTLNVPTHTTNAISQPSNSTTTGKWGNASWTLDNSGNLNISNGTIGNNVNQSASFDKNKVNNISFSNVSVSPDASNLFNGYSSLKKIDVNGLNTDQVTNMNHMFADDSNLTTIDNLDHLDTSKANDMSYMFANNGNFVINNSDIKNWHTGNVNNMSHMFENDSSLTILDISHWDTSHVYYMNSMFNNDKNLSTLIINGIDTSKVQDFSSIFSNNQSLSNLDVSGLNTQSATSMDSMFANDPLLQQIDVSHFDTGNVQKMGNMFNGDLTVSQLDVSHFNTQNVTDMNHMFANDKKLFIIRGLSSVSDLNPNFTTSKVTDSGEYSGDGFGGMFYNDGSLQSLDVNNFDTSHAHNLSYMFSGLSSLNSLDASHFDTSNVLNMDNMFSGLSSIVDLKINGWNTQNVDVMSNMFNGDVKLIKLDLSSFYTPNAHYMAGMFNGLNNLVELDIPHFDTHNVLYMDGMFNGLNKLPNLDVSHFNTQNVISMHYMFGGMNTIQHLDVSHFNTQNVTDMSGMFAGCSSLNGLDVRSFNTSKVANMNSMFYQDSNIKDLDLSNFDTHNVTDMGNMLANNAVVRKITFGKNFSTTQAINSINDFWGSQFDQGYDTRDPHLIEIKILGNKTVFKNLSYVPGTKWLNLDDGDVIPSSTFNDGNPHPGDWINDNSNNFSKFQNAINQGINDARTGEDTYQTDGDPDVNSVNQKLYHNAKSAYQAGLNNSSNSSSEAQSNPVAYNLGQAARQGIIDAQNGNQNSTDYSNNSNTDIKNEYNNAKKAYQNKDAGLNVNASDASQAANQGVSDAKTGIDNQNYSQNKIVQNAYNQANQAYNNGLKLNSNQAGDPNAYSIGSADRNVIANTGVSDARSNQYHPEKYQNQNQQDIYNAANQAYENGLNGQTDDSDSNANNEGKADRTIAEQTGISDTQNNQYHQNKYPNKKQQSIYDVAHNAYVNGINGKVDSSDLNANNAGIKDRNTAEQVGIHDAQTGQFSGSKYQNKLQQGVYNDAHDAYINGLNGKTDDRNQKANEIGKADRITAEQDGVKDTQDGTYESNKYQSNTAQNDFYQKAHNAYENGLKGIQDSSDPDANNAGIKDRNTAEQAGINDTRGGSYSSSKYSKNPTQNDVYQKSHTAYVKGLNNLPDSNDLKANEIGHADRNVAEQAGINDTKNNTYNSDSSNQFANNQYQKQIYQQSHDAYNNGLNGVSDNANPIANAAGKADRVTAEQAGINDAKGNQNHSNDYKNPIQQSIYSQAHQSYENGLAGKPDENGDANAFSIGRADRTTAEQASINDSNSGNYDANKYSDNPAKNSVYRQVRKAYENGLTGQPNDNDDSNGYAAGKAFRNEIQQNGVNDTQNNQYNANRYHDSVQQNIYNQSHQSYLDGVDGKTNSDDVNANNIGKAVRAGITSAENNVPLQFNNGESEQFKQYAEKAREAIIAGLGIDSINGANDNPYAYSIGQAIKQGISDAQSGKTTSSFANSDNPAVKQAYDNAKVAYTNGANGKTGSNAGMPIANNEGYQHYQSSSSIPSGNDHGNSIPDRGNPSNPSSGNSSNHHNHDDDYQRGINDAANHYHSKPKANTDYAYHIGYDAYKRGWSGKPINQKQFNKLSKHYQRDYEESYRAGLAKHRQDIHDGTLAAYHDVIDYQNPANLNDYSVAYAKAYRKEYRQMLRIHLPHYVYNLGTVYRHSSYNFSRQNRVEKYKRATRPNRHVFKVIGFRRTASGKIRYHVRGGGWITSNRLLIVHAYYRANHSRTAGKWIRVIKRGGTYVYNDQQFNDGTKIKFLPTGTKLRVKKAIQLDNLTRFYIGNGKYVSSNKTIVDTIKF
ncbi:hypothetical protein WR164_12690 [Philodulcilactobacillus myokoensis]|uniref:DUF5776 domain-containing protein n=1 Tax=Philodulcilactobacillus myokoensis TaxID=2929573 RepID=A0A9W6B1Q5_9LACO|nr:BspA family leucine-rich repeat surface protein [Philodulcilactobacillus myokoensis]GLB47290.1 hypothetical protein WR164_12690 [Philodulcilactobacillus myokoensis]